MASSLLRIVLANVLVLAAVGQPIRLKRRDIDTTVERTAKAGERSAASGVARHWIVQFADEPGEDKANLLRERGIPVLAYVHANSFMVTAARELLEEPDLEITWIGALEPEDKISAEFDADPAEAVVVIEFHSDINLDEARTQVLAAGGLLREHPDLRSDQLLAVLDRAAVHSLAELDSVAYLFPASAEMIAGAPQVACWTAGTAAGAPAQYVATAGEGWDGPGRGSAAVTYTFERITEQLPAEQVLSEIRRAFAEWSKAVKVTFTPSSTAGTRNINVLFAKRAHDDGYAFDGPRGILAHTFYPPPVHREPLAGDMHLDDDEAWRIGVTTDVFSVALHELGHALGLGHSDRPGTVMYPYFAQFTGLTPEDIAAIRSLYASTTTGDPVVSPLSLIVNAVTGATTAEQIQLSGKIEGGSSPYTLRWSTDRSAAGAIANAAVWSFSMPLTNGPNSVTLTATDSRGSAVSRTISIYRQPSAAVTLRLTNPTTANVFSVATSAVTIGGTATYAAGIRRVEWSNSRGGSGIALGTATWQAALSLADGLNTVTIKATANDGQTASLALQITYARQAARDTTPPALSVTSPSGNSVFTSASTIVLRGTATDNVGVTAVQWFTNGGDSGSASGLPNWTTAAIPIHSGYTTIIVRAFDAAGNMSWRSIQVTKP